ncbi:HAD family hydrolase [Patulibacter minatonensis]|uniref:HAD family hydrolase n=1 Tax=Patulibacter minatonensis TaxID=298163 RepID=UPI00047B8000|nr:HAD family phosphatase [Patulibacter minatonensis]
MRPSLVVFDCDGVLVDSERPQAAVLSALFRDHGAAVSATDVVERYTGLALEAIADDVAARTGVRLPAGWTDEFRDRRATTFERDGIPAVPGVREAVQAVRAAGIPYGVASQGRLSKTALTLRLSGLADLFPEPVRFSADQVPRPKPFPDLFLLAARTLGGEPSATVVVEDSVPGVTAARAAGMRVLGHAAETDPEDLRAAGAEPFRAMAELPGLLRL